MKPILDLTPASSLDALTARLEAMVAAAPEREEPTMPAVAGPPSGASHVRISTGTGMPARYREPWELPREPEWRERFLRVRERVRGKGLLALIGPRGTGKTRMAAEAMRRYSPDLGCYTTAMGFFLRLRASFSKTAAETEAEIVKELAGAPLLVLDEIQERSDSAWEDRMLTHLLDARYGAMRPTIVIANLTQEGLIECLGDSICSRLMETGGVLELAGPSHRGRGEATETQESRTQNPEKR
ncbi:ATP-binding protein [Luteolibacter sp. LG18]|uniref:ATP-binding protein n=1 Tax=Luteolibacter sp. LG18 TaxID=2819286 RepID=UPI002B304CF8|nr:hypothetical protein llg_27040 [Luteolibacter sp. LG18]